MKKYSLLLICIIQYSVSAQVSIGKEQTNGESTLLDFEEINNTKGIIIPSVENFIQVKKGTTQENGIFIFDKTDAKVKVFENDLWKDLSTSGASTDVINYTTRTDLGTGVIIGNENSNAEGVLILESDNMAMILPKINNPHNAVGNPYPGMICYDTETSALAVYNGQVWTYW